MQITFKNYKNLLDYETDELLNLRNQDYIRNSSFDTKIIQKAEHLNWIKNLINAQYFAVFLDGKIIGGLNYTINENKFSWGVFFDKDTNPFIKVVCVYEFLNFIFLRFDKLYSYVKPNNENSIKFTTNFGFYKIYKDQDMIKFSLTKDEWQDHKTKKLLKFVDTLKTKIKLDGDIYE
ncbi:hypothetical protein CSPB12327_05560 [Campylobacter sp. RM12327]|uniref:hypothetical protein n=1 Tax=Campylobacter sputorum TaxID=206 RepID=UPI000B7790E3|nr:MULTISPECIES: hypothetical protein [Campylobacter]ASM40709.1 UDP-4-amino-4,6-dideoxy-beta-L-AltNAc o-acetyltransferase [Campylobacter sputorum]MBE7357991.1 hypothetical protein [Campylobacter sp. RM11302]MBF6669606.1 hypothetical protein [Campylobacter sp. RM12327]MBF6674921.1 hypothetical protein [Campylobacter sp. RM13538]MBF6676771.1 hypothetical protein [Campylobacter sp. RM12321]